MLLWIKRRTLAFWVAGVMSTFLCGLQLVNIIWSLSHIEDIGVDALLLPATIIVFLVAVTILFFLTLGIYRRNRVADGLSVIIFPLLIPFVLAALGLDNNPEHDSKTVEALALVLMVCIAFVLIRDFRRNKPVKKTNS